MKRPWTVTIEGVSRRVYTGENTPGKVAAELEEAMENDSWAKQNRHSVARIVGEAAAKNIVAGNILRGDLGDIPFGLIAEVAPIGRRCMLVYLRAEHACASKSLQSDPKSPDSSEKIDEFEFGHS